MNRDCKIFERGWSFVIGRKEQILVDFPLSDIQFLSLNKWLIHFLNIGKDEFHNMFRD